MTTASGESLTFETLLVPSRVRNPATGEPLQLAATFYRGPGDRRPAAGWPLVVFNHGSTAAGKSRADETLRFEIQARYFLSRGFAVLVPMRRGRGASEGPYVEWYDRDPLKLAEGLQHALDDVDAALAFMRAHPDIDARRVVVAGQSRGGLLSVLYAGQQPAGVVGCINFAGGWVDTEGMTDAFTRDMLVRIGSNAFAPSLWLYAANDSIFAPEIVRQWHDAYTGTGGQAQLYVFPPLHDADGHRLLEHPALWQSAVDAFLRQIGFDW